MLKVMRQKTINYITYGLVGVTALAFFVLNSPITSATYQNNVSASVTVNATCSMTATVNTAHTANMIAGTYSGDYTTNNTSPYANGIGKTTIQTFCNDQNGYAIYAVGYTDNTLGNNVIKSASLGSEYDIATGTLTSGTIDNDVSNWAMKVSAVPGTYAPTIVNGFDSFSSVPSTYTKVAKLDFATDSPEGTNLGSKIEMTYAAYISRVQPSGTYTGQVKYSLVHPNRNAENPDYILQDITEWQSELLPEYPVTATDIRDNKTYTVVLLDDGNVWMSQNLDLAGGTPLYSDTSNVPNGYPSDGGVAYYTLPTSSTTGFSDNATAYVYNSNSTTCGDGSPCYSYYSYAAATAGTNPSSNDSFYDICPKNWHLPTTGEFNVLKTAYPNGSALTATPWSGVYGGVYRYSSFHDGGLYGHYWASTSYDTSYAYYFSFNNSTSDTYYSYKNFGFAVRCIFSPEPVQTVQVRYENADGSFTEYETVKNEVAEFGSTFSWSTANIANFDSTTYQSASIPSYVAIAPRTTQVTVYRNTFTQQVEVRYENVDGSWTNYSAVPTATSDARYGSTYSWSTSELPNFDSTTYQAASVSGYTVTEAHTNYVSIYRNNLTQTTEVRYENADGTWGNYTTVDTQNLKYGSSYSWSTAQITNFDSATYQAASVSSYTVTETHTNYVSIYRNTFTCTKQYRLEAGNGDWGNYNPDGTIENVRYGSTCSYTKSVDYYTSQTASVDNVTSNQTLSVSLPRTTYSLTVSAGSNTSNPSGSGTYRWGQVVPVSVDKNTNITCTSYSTPTWTATAGTAPAAGASTSFTMPTSNATITATSTASSVAQTITLSRSGGASGINIGGNNYTGSSVSLTCGTYNISGNYDSNYEFSSWSASGSTSVASTSSASTTLTVSGPGTLTLTGKSSKLYFQDATSAQCGQTMYDNRGTDAYKDIAYTTALINGACWMTRNLDLPGGTTLTPADSNVASNYTLPASSASGFGNEATADSIAYVYNSNSTTCGDGSPCYSYYSFIVAASGTSGVKYGNSSYAYGGNYGYMVMYDICPKGWSLPSPATYTALKNTYTTGAALTASPWYGVYSGSYGSSSLNYGGSSGRYWSAGYERTSSSDVIGLNTGAYALNFDNSSTSVSRKNGNFGYAIRCVAKQ